MPEFIKPGILTRNVLSKRFNCTFRPEIAEFYLFRTLNGAREITDRWLTEYNSERTHESLNYLTAIHSTAEKPVMTDFRCLPLDRRVIDFLRSFNEMGAQVLRDGTRRVE